jgi:histidine decarboxylase
MMGDEAGNRKRFDVQNLKIRLLEERSLTLGLPASRRLADLSQLGILSGVAINNAGDPFRNGLPSGYDVHAVEREVLEMVAPFFVGERNPFWGFMADSSTSAIMQGLLTARELLPHATVYHSAAAHKCVTRICRALRMPTVVLPVDEDDKVIPEAASDLIYHREPNIFLATLGTTMKETLDDVVLLRQLAHEDSYIHIDAALSGPRLAFDPKYQWMVKVDPEMAANSVSFSTHKAMGTDDPGGIFIGYPDDARRMAYDLPYLHTTVSTLATSRNGRNCLQTRLILELGFDKLLEIWRMYQEWAEIIACRIPDAKRWPHAFTVYFPEAKEHIANTYGVMTEGDVSKICVMPGVPREALHLFIAEMHGRDPHDPFTNCF